MSVSQYELVSFKLCPYVQRAVITLHEKKVPFRRTDIALKNKPDWFLEKSPTGKVPMLIVDDHDVLFESAVICEFIDETTPDSLLSADPLARARQRGWIEFGSTILNQIGQLYSVDTQGKFESALTALKASFSRIEDEIVQPFFSGMEFTMVDAVFAPVFRYFDVFEQALYLGVFRDLPRAQAWRAALQQRPSVINAVANDYADALIEFVISKDSYLGRALKQGAINHDQKD